MISILIIDDEYVVRLPWLLSQIQELGVDSYSLLCLTEMPTPAELVEFIPQVICWDNDLGGGKETSTVLHNWIWKLKGEEREAVCTVLYGALHLIHSANSVRNQEIKSKLEDLGVPSSHICVRSIAGGV